MLIAAMNNTYSFLCTHKESLWYMLSLDMIISLENKYSPTFLQKFLANKSYYKHYDFSDEDPLSDVDYIFLLKVTKYIGIESNTIIKPFKTFNTNKIMKIKKMKPKDDGKTTKQ